MQLKINIFFLLFKVIYVYIIKMDKSIIIKKFNNLLNSFLVQLSPILGSTYLFYFKKLCKYNAIAPLNYFINNIYQYKNQIMDKDISYFKNDNQVVKDCDSDDYKLQEIFKLRGIFDKINEKSRNNTWMYLQALIGLAEEYVILKKN